MDLPTAARRMPGVLAFMAELQKFAAECTALGLWDDELTMRRRQREEPRAAELHREEALVKAL